MPTRRYAELLAALYARRRFGMVLGTERVAAVARRLGWGAGASPPAVIRIAGTNGKGSTAAFVAAALGAAGVRAGRFSSPHLCRFTERFHVEGREVLEVEIVDAAARVDAAGGAALTFFEYATAMALALFRAAQLDVAVLEVGLGGRLDATRAVPADVAAVTGVSFDHQAALGHTLADIAREKAGTFEPRRPAVIGRAGEAESPALLVDQALRLGADPIVEVGGAFDGPLGLVGAHQRDNAATALSILHAGADRGLFERRHDAWVRGFLGTTLPGRFEVVREAPRVIIDGAHNVSGARALAAALRAAKGERVLSVIGTSADKDVAGLVAPILEVVDEVWATRSRHSRAFPVGDLARLIPGSRPVASVAGAMDAAVAAAGSGDIVVACGSLFVAGEARAWATGERVDPIAATES